MAIGGGTGLAVVLRGLKPSVGRAIQRLAAVVTVADDGGSSGRLRREFGVPPPGDIRNCIVALADDEAMLARLFQYRFQNGDGLSGHSFGNLFLTALTGVTGDFAHAVSTAEKILSVRGKILPASLDDVRLIGRGASGRVYEGESAIGGSGERLEAIALQPSTPVAYPPAVDAIRNADLIVLGPGSLYTSVLPNLLIPEIRRSLARARAPRVLVTNLMTQPGETDGMDAAAHVRAILRHAGELEAESLIDHVLVPDRQPSAAVLALYRAAGSEPVRAERAQLTELGVEVRAGDVVIEDGQYVRHDPARLASHLLSLVREVA